MLFGYLSESTLGSEPDILTASLVTAVFQGLAVLEFSRGAELLEFTSFYIFRGICQVGLHHTAWVFLTVSFPREAEALLAALTGWVLDTGRIPAQPPSFSGELALLPGM